MNCEFTHVVDNPEKSLVDIYRENTIREARKQLSKIYGFVYNKPVSIAFHLIG